jgi:7-carboxy-7-deazaguanine synthase
MILTNMEIEQELPIMEAFYTLQGEGFHNGKAAYFIRVGGCDVGCVWCDVKESWDAEIHPKQKLSQIVNDALAFPGKLAVITGGEPLMYDMLPLTTLLKENGFQTNIETSGAYPMSGIWDWVCFSPKKFKAPHESIFEKANELKVIIYNKSDYKFAEEFAQKVNQDCILLLQPEWGMQDKHLPEIIEFVKQNPKWRISLQTHKYMNIP